MVTLSRVTRLLRALHGIARSPRSFLRDLWNLLAHYAARLDASAEPASEAPLPETTSLARSRPFRLTTEECHLNVLLPGLVRRALSGGPNTAIALALRLARDGLPVRFVSTDVPADTPEELWKHFRTLIDTESLENVSFVNGVHKPLAVGANDVLLATAWWTAYRGARVAAALHRPFLYLIQDFEPGFYPWSSTFALALDTYGWDFRAIVNEDTLLDYLATQRVGRFSDPGFAKACAVITPAIDRRYFYPEIGERPRQRRLLFYARPSAPRNLFETGLEALRTAAAYGVLDDWQILTIGERVGPIRLADDVVLESAPWLPYDEYAALIRSSDLGLALMMSPHTGYPVLEFAASGTPVVTNAYATKTRQALAEISPLIVAADPTASGIAAALQRVLERPPEPGSDTPRVPLPGSWDEALDLVVPRVSEMIEECQRSRG